MLYSIQNERKVYDYLILKIGFFIFFPVCYLLTKKYKYSLITTGILMGLLSSNIHKDDVQEHDNIKIHENFSYMPQFGSIGKTHTSVVLTYIFSWLLGDKSKQAVLSLLRLTHFHLAPKVQFFNLQKIPDRCIILMHHRRHHHPGLSVTEFSDFATVLSPNVPFVVVTGRHWGTSKTLTNRFLKYLEESIYNAYDVAECSGKNQDECYYRLLEIFEKRQGPLHVVIFPDKFGAQRFGDRDMFYRSGAFATAMAASVPIVDTLSMYPTFAEPRHSFEIVSNVKPTHWWPDKLELTSERSENIKLYSKFRIDNALKIQYLKDSMEKLFFEAIEKRESEIASCDIHATLNGDQCKHCVYINKSNGAVCN